MIYCCDEYKNKKCLVTGGTGLIGRALVKLLCDMGAKVTSISLDDIQLDKRVTYLKKDLRYYDNCLGVTRDKDFVFHIAGIKASPAITNTKPATMSIPALMANTNILEACRIGRVGKVLFTSSIGAYEQAEILREENAYNGQPMDFLPGWVKRMAEFQIQGYAKEYGIKWVITRLASVYGKGDNFDPDNAMFVPSLMAKVYRGDNPVIVWGDGLAKRDLAYSKDIALGILQAMIYVNDSLPINLGSGKGYSVKEVVETLKSIVPFNYEFDTTKPSGVQKRVMDIEKARKFGYKAETTLSEGLRKTWDWFIKHPNEYEKRQNYFKELK